MITKCTWRSGVLAAVMAVSLALAGCGGGGSGATSSSGGIVPGATSSSGGIAPGAPAGPSTVEVSLNAVPATGSTAAPVTVAGSTTVSSADPTFDWADHVPGPSPKIAHVYMDVVKLSLMPAEEVSEGEDMDGDIGEDNSPDSRNGEHGDGEHGDPHFVTLVPDSPIRIDLLKLENGKKLARFLNRFDQVLAGTYDKIRVYYQNVKVVLADGSTLRFQPTANSKFDIRFREGHELVIPAMSDTTKTDGWAKFFRVKLDVVGLKLKIPGGEKKWKGCKVILRPQIFAEFVPPIQYSVAGTADNVIGFQSPTVSGTFDVVYGTGPGYPRTINAAFDNNTTWAWSDNVLGASPWTVERGNRLAVASFRDRATVEAIGRFDAAKVFQARDIVFTFPDVRRGTADNVWIPTDNVAFIVRSLLDNVVVFPTPDRFTAYYDNLVEPHGIRAQAAVDNNDVVKVRGYFRTNVVTPYTNPPIAEIDAYWISIGDPTVNPVNP